MNYFPPLLVRRMGSGFSLLFLLVAFLLSPLFSFSQNHTMPASGTDEIDWCSGTVQDPGGSGNYGINQNGILIIDPIGSGTVTLTFSEFALENAFDDFYIFDGRGVNGTQIGAYTGTGSPGTVTSSSDAITIQLVSDGSNVAAGFTAAISTSHTPVSAGTLSAGGPTSFCEGGTVDLNYTFGTGSYKQWQYSFDGITYIDITGESGTAYTVPTSQEGGKYYYRVFEGSSSEINCGTAYSNVIEVDISPASFVGGVSIDNACSGGTATLIYDRGDIGTLQWQSSPDGVGSWSDISGATTAIYAFTQTTSEYYRLEYDFSGCGGTGFSSVIQGVAEDCRNMPITGTEVTNECIGTVRDPGGTGNYGTNQDGVLIIDPPGTGPVTLVFSEFVLENAFDDITIYDGSGTGGTVIGTYTGTGSPGTVSSTSGAISIELGFDGSNVAAGFTFSYSVNNPTVSNDPSIAASGSLSYCAGNELDLSYTPSSDDTWNWEYSTDGTNFEELSFASGADYTVPSYLSSGRHYYRVVGSSGDGCYTYVSETENVVVIPSGGAGAIAISDNCSGQTGTVMYRGVDAGTYQWQSSSDGDNWADISSETGTTYSFTEGTPVMYRLWVDYSPCGSAEYSNVVHSYPANCPLTGVSEYAMTATTLTDCEGILRDPGGTGNYASNADVTTVIDPIGDGLIQVRFSEFNSEAGLDVLNVYDGTGTTNGIGAYSGTTVPADILSTQEALTFRFTSDNSFTYAGFALSYSVVYSGGFEAGVLSPGGDSTICTGADLDLTYTPGDGDTYQWQMSTDRLAFSDIASETGLSYSVPTNLGSGTYYFWVKESKSGSCFTSYSNILEVTVEGEPIDVITMSNTGGCVGGAIDLAYSGNTSATFQWQSSPDNSDWSDIGGATASTYSDVSDGENTYYRLHVNYGACNVDYTSSISSEEFYCQDTDYTISSCSGKIVDSGGDGGDYAEGESYTITIDPDNATTIDVTFTTFDLNADGTDVLEFFDGPSVASPLITSTSTNPGTVSSTGNVMTIRFTSEQRATDYGWPVGVVMSNSVGAGWVANFTGNCTEEEPAHGKFFLKSAIADPTEISNWYSASNEIVAESASQFTNDQDTFVVAVGTWLGGVIDTYIPASVTMTQDITIRHLVIPEGGTSFSNDGYDLVITGHIEIGEGSSYYHHSIDQDPSAGVEKTEDFPFDKLKNNELEGTLYLSSESVAVKNDWNLTQDLVWDTTGAVYNNGDWDLSGGYSLAVKSYGSSQTNSVTSVTDNGTKIEVDSLLDFTSGMGAHFVSASNDVAFAFADSILLKGNLQVTTNMDGQFGGTVLLSSLATLDWSDRQGVTLTDSLIVRERIPDGTSGVRFLEDFETLAGDTISFLVSTTVEDGDENVVVGATSRLTLRQGTVADLTIENGARLTVVEPSFLGVLNHSNVNIEAGGLFLCSDGSSLSQAGGTAIYVEAGPVPFSQGGSFVDLDSFLGSSYGGAPNIEASNNIGWTGWTQYTYWSSPIYSGSFSVIGNHASKYYYADMNQGQQAWTAAPGTFSSGRGYAVQQAGGGIVDFVGQAQTGPIEGPDIGDDQIGTADENWTLIGNPYPSPISALELVLNNAGMNGAMYIWDQSSFNTTWGFESEDYVVINGSGAVGPDVSGYPDDISDFWIAPFQGFMVEGVDDETPDAVEFENYMRDPDLITEYGHSFKSGDKRKMWLGLQEYGLEQPLKTSCLIAFMPEATNKWDRVYDASNNAEGMAISSLVELGNDVVKKAVIQGLPTFSGNEELNLQMDLPAAGEFALALDSLVNMDGQEIWIIDPQRQSQHKLDESSYLFVAENSGPYFLTLQFREPASNPIGIAEVGTAIYPFEYSNGTITILKDGTGLISNVVGQLVYRGGVNKGEEIAVTDFPVVFLFTDANGKQYSRKIVR